MMFEPFFNYFLKYSNHLNQYVLFNFMTVFYNDNGNGNATPNGNDKGNGNVTRLKMQEQLFK